MDLSYLKELGYSEKEIKDYSTHWCEGHIAYLADQKENVFVNMKYLQPYFNKELLLKFPIYYIDSFSMEPDLFEKRIDMIREAFPDEWTDMIEKQFYGYSGIAGSNYKPILQLLGSLNNSDFTAALDQLSHPETIVFEFMVLLKDKLGIDVAAENFENWILELEMCKYEVLRNAEWLIADGLPADFVEELLYQAPYLMMLSKMEFKKIFISEFGENYIAKIQKMDTDEFLEKIGETTW